MLNDKRSPKNKDTAPALMNLDINSITIPSEASSYYPLVDYFLTYSIAGEAISKKAEFIVSGLKIDGDSPEGVEYGERIARKLDIKNKFVRLAIYYFAYGLAVLYPMPRVKKTLECPQCHYTYPLDTLSKNYKPLYRYTDRGEYYARCTNPKCKSRGQERRMQLIEEEVGDIGEYSMAVWPPHQISCIHNTVTDKKKWMYKCDGNLRKLMTERDHYTICTTPENFLKSIVNDSRVTIPGDRLYVLEYPTACISGIPIPPMASAFQDLYQRHLYQKANRHIAEDIMIPLRMLFPIWKGESGSRPLLQTMNAEDWAKNTRRQIETWQSNKSYVPIMPVEVGTKNIWGEGKMFALDDHLKANMQDVLAALGVPLEFIYGGATWSRQNVSAITLENVLKSFSIKLAEPLQFIEESANKMRSKDQKIKIRLDSPRLVDSMMETSLLSQLEAGGKVSLHTLLQTVGKDYDDEMRSVEREQEAARKKNLDARVDLAVAEAEAEKIMYRNEAEKRRIMRIEGLKDSLANRAIEKDQMMFNIYMQEYQYDQQAKMQRMQAKEQVEQQKEMAPVQLEMMKQQLLMNNAAQLDMAKKMQKLQTLGIKQQIKAQYKAQQELEASEQKKQQMEMQRQAVEMMSDEEKQALQQLPPEQQQEMISAYIERAQTMQIYEQMPDEIKQEMEGMSEDQKIHAIQQYGQQIEQEQGAEITEEEQAKLQMAAEKKRVDKQTEEELGAGEIGLMAQEYNNLNAEDRELYRREMMQEDTVRFAKVKSLADTNAVAQYVSALINSENDAQKKEIWATATSKHPDLLDNLMREYHNQMTYMQQAASYAYKLLTTKGTPEYDQITQEIKDNSPQEFRQMVINEYKKLIGYNQGDNEEMKVEEAAQYLGNLSPEDRATALESIKHDDPDMHRKVTTMLQGSNNNG